MTAGELIDMLSELDADTEVRIASQPSWPLESRILDVTAPDETSDGYVYLAAAEVGYLPGEARQALGW